MRRCGALDCSSINRETCLCALPFIELNKGGCCILYRQNKEHLDLLLRRYVRGGLQSEGYDPETQEMVDIAKSLHHTPSRKAGEEGRQSCLE